MRVARMPTSFDDLVAFFGSASFFNVACNQTNDTKMCKASIGHNESTWD